MTATVYSFGEWLPDLPELANPGLVTAKNVLPSTAGYSAFLPLSTALGTLTASGVLGAINALGATKGASYVYAFGSDGNFWVAGNGGASTFATKGSSSSSANEKFTQFDNIVIGVNSAALPMSHTVGSASNFATLSASAPKANTIGVINKFVVLGDLVDTAATSRPSVISWSGIDAPTNWPPPNSATAIAVQSGEQEMPLEFGPVVDILGGDQYGVVMQTNGISRMTYEGPPVVFRFDVIDATEGSYFVFGAVQVGRLIYFLSVKGFCMTDGVSVQRIGDGKVDRFFWENFYQNAGTAILSSGYDPIDELVYWAFPTSAPGTANDTIIIYNPRTSKWTYASQSVQKLVSSGAAFGQPPVHIGGFNVGSSAIFGRFNATAGAATLTTGDLELNPGGRAYVDGVKPNIESTGTAPAITVRVGTRSDLGTAPTYTATTTPTTRTGFADFRLDAKYHRAEVQIVGNFDKAVGIEFKAVPTGEV